MRTIIIITPASAALPIFLKGSDISSGTLLLIYRKIPATKPKISINPTIAPIFSYPLFIFYHLKQIHIQQARNIIAPLNPTNPSTYNLYMPGTTIPTTKQTSIVPANTNIGIEKELNASIGFISTPNAIRKANSPHSVKTFILNNSSNILFHVPLLFLNFISKNFIPTEENYKNVGIGIKTKIIYSPQNIRNVDIEVKGESQYPWGQTKTTPEWKFHSCPKFLRCLHPHFSKNELSYTDVLHQEVFASSFLFKLHWGC